MSTPEEIIADQLGEELEIRIAIWTAERETLLGAMARIAVLDALLARAKGSTAEPVPVCRKERRGDAAGAFAEFAVEPDNLK